jgi:hypothetical protein
VDQALPLLENFPGIANKLRTLQSVGLGYIELGQSATTLSGGEAQRVKLAKELSKRGTGRTLYILDEPTTGLHFEDTRKLLDVLNKLVDQGNTIVVIEHNLDVIKCADYVIDLGPEGGAAGGRIIAEGTPEEVAGNDQSATGDAFDVLHYIARKRLAAGRLNIGKSFAGANQPQSINRLIAFSGGNCVDDQVTVGRTIRAVLDARDDVAIKRVELFLDGVSQGLRTVPPYTFDVVTSGIPRDVLLHAVATDSADHAASADKTVHLVVSVSSKFTSKFNAGKLLHRVPRAPARGP